MKERVVVIGAGAAGCVSAHKLAKQGLHVVLLDAGTGSPRSPHEQSIQSQCADCVGDARSLFVSDHEHPYASAGEDEFFWIRSLGRGGRTRVWNNVCVWPSSEEWSSSGSNDQALRWPCDPDVLLPHRNEVFEHLGVKAQPTASFDVRGAAEKSELSPREAGFLEAVAVALPGSRMGPVPYAPAVDEGQRHCDLFAAFIRDPERDGLVSIVDDAFVHRLNYSGTQVTSIEYSHQGELRRSSADAVVLCASALESTKILLESRATLEQQLPGPSEVLGHYLSEHLMIRALGRSENPGTKRRTGRGVFVQPRHFEHGVPFQVQVYVSGDVRGSTIELVAFGEAESRAENRVRMTSGDATKEFAIEYRRSSRDKLVEAEMSAFLKRLAVIGGFELAKEPEPDSPGLSAHEVGTARMGRTDDSSFLNSWCQSWEAPNLFVPDGAAFPRAGCANPTAMIMTLASRAMERLRLQMKQGRFDAYA